MGNKIQVCSIDPNGFMGIAKRTYGGDLDIPACPPDKPYVSKWYEDAMDYKIVLTDYWIEHAEKVPIPISAEEIVRDVMNSENMVNRGCFIPKGDKPTPEELDLAHATRIAYMQSCVRAGDTEYARTSRIDDIPQEYKRYVKELGIEREWAFHAKPKSADVPCPACAGDIKFGVAVCKHCGAILDRGKAEEFGLVPKAEKEKAVKG